MVADRGETRRGKNGSDPPVAKVSELAAAFSARAQEVFGKHRNAQQDAEDDAFRLWLAWRGDPAYLIANLGGRGEREGLWRVVKYTEIPGLSETHNQVEARGLGQDFPEHVLARLFQFVSREASRTPGAEASLDGTETSPSPNHPGRVLQDDAYGRVKAGEVLTVRWPSKGAQGLFARIIVLSKGSIEDSKYPGLESASGARGRGDSRFTKFLERADRKRQKRWVRWVTHG